MTGPAPQEYPAPLVNSAPLVSSAPHDSSAPREGPAPQENPASGVGLADVRPAYGAASLADVLPGILTALGVPGATDPLDLAQARAGPGPLGELAGGGLAEVRAVLVLLVDGLGQHTLPFAVPHAPTLRDLVTGRLAGASARAITTGFPSTTPTSLVSLGTGAAPGSHGLLGFFLNIPGTDRVLNHIAWRDEPDPLRWQPLTTQFDRAERAGVATRIVGRPEYTGSGLTSAAFRGGAYVEASGVGAIAASMLGGLAPRPSIAYGYLPDVDKAGHEFGVDSPQWREAVAMVDRLLTALVEGLTPGTALVVTADHGQVNIPAGHRFDLDADPRLREGVRVIAGEPRVRYLHTLPGARDDVLATWRGVLGDAAWVVARDEAVAQGWFGPVPEDHLLRIGDVVAACHRDHVVLGHRTDSPDTLANIAFHGSATAAEMMIPLLVVRR